METTRSHSGYKVVWNGTQAWKRVSTSEVTDQRLRNEARTLKAIGGIFAPRLLEVVRNEDHLTLIRSYISGPLFKLSDYGLEGRQRIRNQLETSLSQVHTLGWIHGDISPENIVINEEGPVLIDWEHALEIGNRLDNTAFRAVQPGFTHPDQIWGRGLVRPELDFYALDKVFQNT